MGTAEGAALLGVDAGAIEVGRAADLVAVDLGASVAAPADAAC